MNIDTLIYQAERRRLPPPEVRRVLRRNAGLSQNTVAKEFKVARTTITRWENGIRTPRGEQLEAYVELLERLKAAT